MIRSIERTVSPWRRPGCLLGLLAMTTLAGFGCGNGGSSAPSAATTPSGTTPGETSKTTIPEPGTTQPETPETLPTPPKPPTAVGWTLDLKEMAFLDTPVKGQLHGKPFQVTSARISNRGILTLREGTPPAPVREVNIALPSGKEDGAPSQLLEITPEGGTSALSILAIWTEGEELKTAEYGDKYALRLDLGKADPRKRTCKIYLCLSDAEKSCFAGTFSADVEPYYWTAPLPQDSPCITGKIILPDKKKANLIAGFAGVAGSEEMVSNLAGTEVDPTKDTAVTSEALAPQLTTLANDAEKGCVYWHSHLPPGQYVVYVRHGERFLAWRAVEVKEGARLSVDLTLDPTTGGSVEVTPPKGVEKVQLVPVEAEDKVPERLRLALGGVLDTEVSVQNGKILLAGLRPGTYRLIAGEAEKDVTVKSKETAKVDLSSVP